MDTVKPSHNKCRDDDPLEAIFALNMGDFITENLLSDELLAKISQSVTQNPQRLKSQLEELVDIYSIDNTLSLLGFRASEGHVIYDSVALSLASMLEVDACHIFQILSKNGQGSVLSLTGTSVEASPGNPWQIGFELTDSDSVYVEALDEGYPMVVVDVATLGEGRWQPIAELNQAQTQSFIAVPLIDGFTPLGVLVFETYATTDFEQEAVDLAESTGNLFVVSLQLQRLLEKTRTLIAKPDAEFAHSDEKEMLNLRAQLTEAIGDLGRYQQFFVESLAFAIDARNHYTRGHSQGVAQIARDIAEEMGLNEKAVDLVYYAGMLSSLGKISVPQHILTKKDGLTPDEIKLLKNHPNVGVGLLMKMNFLAEVVPYVDFHKERWDGKDNHHNLSGRSIPLGARIVAVADAFHALTQERPYRDTPMSEAEALTVLQGESGTRWDPEVVDSLAARLAQSAS